MATSVHNNNFNRLEPSSDRIIRTLRVGSNYDFSSSSDHKRTTKPGLIEYDSCSEDDDDVIKPQWTELIKKGKNELSESSILDPRDESTADNWIKRNPTLVRLTGKHPFNCEPPLDQLMSHGFITPAPIHYVRNHGPVPRGIYDEWTVEITGLVKRPVKLTMNQLVNEFVSYQLPVSLVCAGNRRKEQNMVKRTTGFNWGAAAVATSVWRGVRLCDVLKRCGIISRKNGAMNVCFEGAEDLPGGGGSKYGTSVSKEVAMDPSRDILLAYMQNGEVLLPDHGFPVRMIIPGYIGGRMVKWLKRIVVATDQSDSYYHFRDNKVLPSHVDAELANTESWWYKPEYTINELNVNSAITTPSHQEILPINAWTTQMPYTMKGYAYSGGGNKVTRVEITMDGGDTWRNCEVEYHEKPTKYGKYWCWCFWSVEVEVLDLLGAKDIAVRAWDQSHNTQPDKLIWNLLGMMNNCWFRVKTNVCKPHKGEIGIVFEHPTQPGNIDGGWMAKEKHTEKALEANTTLKKTLSTPAMNTSSKIFSASEVKKHNTPDSAWIIVNDHVYDCTNFLKEHPGGSDSILINAGSDCTEEFDAIHSDKAKNLLEDYRIGELNTSSSPTNSDQNVSNLSTRLTSIKESATTFAKIALVPREKIPCRLVSKTSISRDVRIFRFALPSEEQLLGLPVGKHIFLCVKVDGKLCMRAYTPTSTVDKVGYFELLIKVYFKDAVPNFPNGGLMSQYLDSLPLGSTIDVKGPVGHIEYNGHGNFMVHGKPKFAKKLAMIAGGTGITPIYQVIQAILQDPEDKTEMHVVYANRTEDDILLREDLDAWAKRNERLKVWYVIGASVREGWKYSVGRICESILMEHIPDGSDDSLALVCGPPGLIQLTITPNLEKMKYDIKEQLLVF